LNIGVFTDSYKPYTSGVVTSIGTFRDELERQGHTVHIFAPGYPYYRDREPNIHRFASVPAPGNPDYTLAIPVSPRIYALNKKLGLDLVHVHSPFILGLYGAKVARRYQLPLVFTYHTMYDQYVHYVPVARELARDVTVKYSRHFCNQCDLVIAPSSEVREMVGQHGIQTPVAVIPTGVPLRKFAQGDDEWLRRYYQIDKEKLICLFVGRLTKEKNIDFLLKAFREVRDEQPDAVLVIVATGPLEEELKALTVDLGLELGADVIFTGYLSNENLVNAYRGADLFTFGSVTETQGLVLIEAMAAGTPVVAIRAGGVPDMVEHEVDGLLTDYNQREFVEQIIRVLSDHDLRQRLKVGALTKASSLSAEVKAKELEARYIELVEGKQSDREHLNQVKIS